jgi:hypothetical protein
VCGDRPPRGPSGPGAEDGRYRAARPRGRGRPGLPGLPTPDPPGRPLRTPQPPIPPLLAPRRGGGLPRPRAWQTGPSATPEGPGNGLHGARTQARSVRWPPPRPPGGSPLGLPPGVGPARSRPRRFPPHHPRRSLCRCRFPASPAPTACRERRYAACSAARAPLQPHRDCPAFLAARGAGRSRNATA